MATDSFISHTERLILRRFGVDDAPFILQLLNDRTFVEFIGDKQVRNLADARRYIEEGAIVSYAKHGFGPYLVVRAEGSLPVGMCGLYQRAGLPLPDLGFAFLKAHTGQGFAEESAQAVIDLSAQTLGLSELAAIVNEDNERSIRLLDRLGFEFRSLYELPDEDTSLRCYICSTAKRSDSLE